MLTNRISFHLLVLVVISICRWSVIVVVSKLVPSEETATYGLVTRVLLCLHLVSEGAWLDLAAEGVRKRWCHILAAVISLDDFEAFSCCLGAILLDTFNVFV